MTIFTLLLLLSVAFTLHAEEIPENEVLTIDEPILGSMDIEFDNADDLLPKTGDFLISSNLLMSNQLGERWAVLTIQNRSSSQRLLDREHIVALFANGEKRYPQYAEYTFYGKEQKTMTISFGESKFPIVKVEMRNR
ncbi:MAG: hypothetical protein ABW139_04885 [Candidatus Thiodiazotropha sp. DIVDIV]